MISVILPNKMIINLNTKKFLSVLLPLCTCPYDQWAVHSMVGYLLQINYSLILQLV